MKFLAAVLLGLAAPAAANEAVLNVQFDQIEVPTGQIMLSVYDNEVAHDGGGKPVRVAAVKVEGASATVTFHGLAPGRYAIKAFHDIDGDGQMGTNPFGMPTEPFAFSNNARPQGGPPKWSAASFAVATGTSTTRIIIK
jgi:uncharacterized protein (DUF2141 family)